MIIFFTVFGLVLFVVGFVSWLNSWKNEEAVAHCRSLVIMAVAGWVVVFARLSNYFVLQNKGNPILLGILAVIVGVYTIYVTAFTVRFVS